MSEMSDDERARMLAALWGQDITPDVGQLVALLQRLGFRLPPAVNR